MSDKIKVVNHRDSSVILRRVVKENPIVFGLLQLETGANVCDAAEFESFIGGNPIAKSFVDHGLLSVEQYVEGTAEELPSSVAAGGGDLSKLKIKAALRVIAGCKSERQLRLWINQDGRPDVRKALIERHQQLTAGSAPSDAD